MSDMDLDLQDRIAEAAKAYEAAFGEHPPARLGSLGATQVDYLAMLEKAISTNTRIPWPEEDLPEGALT